MRDPMTVTRYDEIGWPNWDEVRMRMVSSTTTPATVIRLLACERNQTIRKAADNCAFAPADMIVEHLLCNMYAGDYDIWRHRPSLAPRAADLVFRFGQRARRDGNSYEFQAEWPDQPLELIVSFLYSSGASVFLARNPAFLRRSLSCWWHPRTARFAEPWRKTQPFQLKYSSNSPATPTTGSAMPWPPARIAPPRSCCSNWPRPRKMAGRSSSSIRLVWRLMCHPRHRVVAAGNFGGASE